MSPAPTHLTYEFGGRQEYCLGFGDAKAPRRILIVPPLFDEMNRVRRMLVEAMRTLASHGVSSYLPDLPGCNESLADISTQKLADWQRAVIEAAKQLGATHIASLRGGTLIDHEPVLPHWRLAPVKGSSLLKTMLRTRIAADKEAGLSTTIDALMTQAVSGPLALSGFHLGSAMLASLEGAEPVAVAGCHEVVLDDIDGSALWLRAEPQDDPAMSVALAAELDRWSASCGG